LVPSGSSVTLVVQEGQVLGIGLAALSCGVRSLGGRQINVESR
jgi:hypothetical protein